MMNLLTLKRFAAGVLLVCLGSCGTSTPPKAPPKAQPKAPLMAQKVDSPAQKEEILAQLYDRQKQLDLCAVKLNRERSRQASAIYAIGKQNYLVQVHCFLAAYQGNYEYYFVKKTDSDFQISPLKLTVFNPDAGGKWQREKTKGIAGLPEFDLSSQTLSVFTKRNGAGTCGSLAHYDFKGNSFQLVKYLAKECDDNYIEPEKYPQIYPSTTNN